MNLKCLKELQKNQAQTKLFFMEIILKEDQDKIQIDNKILKKSIKAKLKIYLKKVFQV